MEIITAPPPAPSLITVCSDFAVQSQGVGIMEAVAYSIAPNIRFVHLMHGIKAYSVIDAARTMETLRYVPVGYHVGICDPGVGTSRRALVCHVERGDYLIGPDNGILMPACRALGGIISAHEITNPKYFRHPVSPIFHGRDIFVPAAAHLARGVSSSELGSSINPKDLIPAPYDEASVSEKTVAAKVIHINRFGSAHLNITHEVWDSLGLPLGAQLLLECSDSSAIAVPVCHTFGDVGVGQPLILKDDYGRVAVSLNQGSFCDTHNIQVSDLVSLRLP